MFVGTVRGGPEGTFSTTYRWESQWDPDYTTGGTEIWGRCQHLIVRGSGTGGLHDVTGHLVRTDIAPTRPTAASAAIAASSASRDDHVMSPDASRRSWMVVDDAPGLAGQPPARGAVAGRDQV